MNNTSEIERYKTLLVICLGMLVFYFFTGYIYFIWISLVVSLCGIISPTISTCIVWLWNKLTQALGFVMPKVILTLVYYLILFPLSTISKLFSKNTFHVKNDKTSFFTDVKKEFDKREFEKLW